MRRGRIDCTVNGHMVISKSNLMYNKEGSPAPFRVPHGTFFGKKFV